MPVRRTGLSEDLNKLQQPHFERDSGMPVLFRILGVKHVGGESKNDLR